MFSSLRNLTSYNRIFIIIKVSDNDIFTLPGMSKNLFLLDKGDTIFIQQNEEIKEFCLFDYQLINDRKGNFYNQNKSFIEFVRKHLTLNTNLTLSLMNKVVYNNTLTYNFELIKQEK